MVAVGHQPTDRMRQGDGVVGHREPVPFRPLQQEVDEPVRAGCQALDVEDLLGREAGRVVQHLGTRRVDGEVADQGAIALRRLDVAGDRRAGDDVLRVEGDRLHDARALGKAEVRVADIHEVHGRPGTVHDRDLHGEVGRSGTERDARPDGIVRAEALRVIPHTGDGHPGTALVLADLEPGLVHRHAGHLAVERVIVLRRRRAVAQQAGVIGEAAIGVEDGRSRPGLVEHAPHGELDAVETWRAIPSAP